MILQPCTKEPNLCSGDNYRSAIQLLSCEFLPFKLSMEWDFEDERPRFDVKVKLLSACCDARFVLLDKQWKCGTCLLAKNVPEKQGFVLFSHGKAFSEAQKDACLQEWLITSHPPLETLLLKNVLDHCLTQHALSFLEKAGWAQELRDALVILPAADKDFSC